MTIAFDGEDQAALQAEPYSIAVHFPEGTWEITATARDWSGNVAQTMVVIEVVAGATDGGSASDDGTGEDTSPDSEGAAGTSASGGDTDDVSGDTDDATGADTPDDPGCACTTRPGAPGWAVWCLVPLALARRRFPQRPRARRE